MLGLPIPKPEKFYFSFAERLSSEPYTLDTSSQRLFREIVKNTVEQQITQLKQLRDEERDRNLSLIRKKLTD